MNIEGMIHIREFYGDMHKGKNRRLTMIVHKLEMYQMTRKQLRHPLHLPLSMLPIHCKFENTEIQLN